MADAYSIELDVLPAELTNDVIVMNVDRVFRLIDQAINSFTLDLSGLIVFTEAASGNYVVTPLIAALAEAEKVFAITRDSIHGKAADVKEFTLKLAKMRNVDSRIEVVFNKAPDILRQADIVTNLGFVRPINKEMIEHLKPTSVIPLMWETWEFRELDLDLSCCWQKGIPVLGTSEEDLRVQTRKFIGALAVKLCFEAGLEVAGLRIFVLGNREFKEPIEAALSGVGAAIEREIAKLKKLDLIVIAEHKDANKVIGQKGLITVKRLLKENPMIQILHICGNIDIEELKRANIKIYPQQIASFGYMSASTGYIGPKPVINLQTAGLRVGEMMARQRLANTSFLETIEICLKDNLCQDFSLEQKVKYGYPNVHFFKI